MQPLDKNLYNITPELLLSFSPPHRQTIYNLLNRVQPDQELFIIYDASRDKVFYSFNTIGAIASYEMRTSRSLLTWDRLLRYEFFYGKS